MERSNESYESRTSRVYRESYRQRRRPMSRRYRDADYLREQYVERRRSQQEIAEECDVSTATIRRWLDRYSIEQKPRYKTRKWLYEQYVEQWRNQQEIAEECGVSSSTIYRWLDRHGIERQPRYKNRDWLYEQYVECRRDQQDIADDCGVAKTTICHWLARHGITDGESMEATECTSCGETFRYYPSVRDGQFCSNECSNDLRKRQVGIVCDGCGETFHRRASLDTEYCSMECWGEDTRVTANPQELYRGIWHRQRQRALRRDGYRCVVCGISDEDHSDEYGHGLDIHHLVPVRRFVQCDCPPRDAHALRNLVTVCRTHHPDCGGETVEPVRDNPDEGIEEIRDRFRGDKR
jgi:transposase/5-methylcytosine-specific restriction endonuclease McrA